MKSQKYPVFRNAEDYMKCRVSRTPLGILKTKGERACLERCISSAEGVETICDVPSGPGRLFEFWKQKGLKVHAVDVSRDMVEASHLEHERLDLEGSVRSGDAFKLATQLDERPDLVASIRFLYYFDRDQRIALLQSMAETTKRYVLTQYKTTETLRGQKSLLRKKARLHKRHLQTAFCSYEEIAMEVQAAGLIPLRIDPIGEFSDRVYVLAEKPNVDSSIHTVQAPAEIRLVRPWRNKLALGVITILAFLYCIGITSPSFQNKTEALYALGAKSTLDGNWLLPLVNYEMPLDSAPLMFWWTALVSAPFGGVWEWSARLATVIPALAILALLYFFARRHLGSWSALLGLIVLGTFYEFWDNATSVSPEILSLLFLQLAWCSMYELFMGAFSKSRWFILWSAIAFAILARGPEALLMSFIIAIFFSAYQFGIRDAFRGVMRLRPLTGLILALSPFVLWTASIYEIHGSTLLTSLIQNYDIAPTTKELISEKPWIYYLKELPESMLPWVVFLPLILWFLERDYSTSRGKRMLTHSDSTQNDKVQQNSIVPFAVCVVIVVSLLLALTPTKHDANLLPLLPWCALIIGHWMWHIVALPLRLDQPREAGQHEFGAIMLVSRFGRSLILTSAVFVLGMSSYSLVKDGWKAEGNSPQSFAQEISRSDDAEDSLIILDSDDPRVLYYLNEDFSVLEDNSDGLLRIQSILSEGLPIDLLVKENDLGKIRGLVVPPLYIERILAYRGQSVFRLTSRPEPGLIPVRTNR